MTAYKDGGKWGRLDFYTGGPRTQYVPGWCYLCKTPHLYAYPCPELKAWDKRVNRRRTR